MIFFICVIYYFVEIRIVPSMSHSLNNRLRIPGRIMSVPTLMILYGLELMLILSNEGDTLTGENHTCIEIMAVT